MADYQEYPALAQDVHHRCAAHPTGASGRCGRPLEAPSPRASSQYGPRPHHSAAGADRQRVEHHQLHPGPTPQCPDPRQRDDRDGLPQLYDTGLPNAHFCAYKGVGPNAVVNNTTCRRADGEKEVPMEALASQQPRALYILLGTNVLTSDSDYTSFLTYYRLMLDMISQALPNTKIYVQSITPVRPEVSQKSPGLYKERLCEINDALSAIALEKGCTFLNLWEALADENGDLIESYAQPDGYHLLPAGYDAWVDYLCTHT